MKKLLIACAALGLSLGGANAMDDMAMDGPALSLTGSAGMGLTFMAGEDNTANQNRTSIDHFAKVTFTGEGVTDGGITFGMKVRVNTNKVDDDEVYIKGELWEVRVGDIDPASDMAETLPDVGFDGNLGVDNVAEAALDDTTADVIGKFTFGPVTFGISGGFVTPVDDKGDDRKALKQKNEWALGATFKVDPVAIALGVDSGKATGMGLGKDGTDTSSTDYGNALQASVGGTLGGFTGNLFISQQEIETAVGNGIQTDKVNGIGASLAVGAGPGTTVTAVYTQQDTDPGAPTAPKKTDKGFGLGVTHDLGGGAEVQAGVAKVMDQDKASVGVVMSF